ncbi:hypothetical protein PHSC3_000634 [Chlamydiales bacterium STE3]|nr:hypothetical protein PHSC3_000634 [Chlamydiales bacterium STE3]
MTSNISQKSSLPADCFYNPNIDAENGTEDTPLEQGGSTHFFKRVKEVFGAIGEQASKTTKNTLLHGFDYYANSLRIEDEKYLFSLTGDHQIRIAIGQYMPELCNALELLFPDYFEVVSGHDASKIKRIAENLVLHILVNFAKECFSEKPSQNISKEVFFGKIGSFLLKEIWTHVYAIDNAVLTEDSIDDKQFERLASRLLDIGLPKEQDSYWASFVTNSEKMLAKSFMLKPLKNFLAANYRKFLLREVTETLESTPIFTEENKNALEGLVDLTKKGFSFLINEFAKHIISEENLFFKKTIHSEEIPAILQVILQPVTKRIKSLLPPNYQDLLLEDSEAVPNVISALIMTILSGIGRNILQKKPIDQDADASMIFSEILLSLSEAFHESYTEALSLSEEKGRTKAKYFQPIIEKMLFTLLPDHKDFFELIYRRFPELIHSMSEVVMDLALSAKIKNREKYKQKLRVLLWDSKKILNEHPTLTEIPKVPNEQLSKAFQNEDLLKNIGYFCKVLSEKSVEGIKSLISNEELIHDIVVEAFPMLEEPELVVSIVIGGGQALLSGKKSTETAILFIQGWIRSLLFKGFVHFLENSYDKKKPQVKFLLLNAFKKLISVSSLHLTTIRANLANMDQDAANPSHHFFIPFAKDLMRLFFADKKGKRTFKDVLPLPIWLHSFVERSIIYQALPMFMNKCYHEVLLWDREKENHKKTLYQLFDNNRANETARVLSHFIPEAITSLLELSSETLAEDFLNLIKTSIKIPSNTATLSSHLAFFLKTLGSDKHDFSKLWEFMTFYSEGILLKVFAIFFTKIAKMEQAHLEDLSESHEGDLKITLILEMMGLSKKHFEMINMVKKIVQKKSASPVDNVMIGEFRAAKFLHKAIEDPSERQKEFRKYSDGFLGLLGINQQETLPLPSPVKMSLWSLLEEHLLPKLCQVIFDKIKDPLTVSKVVLNSLISLNQSLDRLQGPRSQNNVNEVPDDHLQRELAEISGDLMNALVNLQPSLLVKKFLSDDSLKNLIGKAVANSIRGTIEEFSTLELVDLLIENSLPSLHPGIWSDKKLSLPVKRKKDVKDHFIPLRKRANGEMKKGYDFSFPHTKTEEDLQKKREQVEQVRVSSEIVKELSGMLSKQSKITLSALFSSMWNHFQSILDREIKENFGDFGVEIKQHLDSCFHTLFSFFIYPTVKIVAFPLIKLTWALLKYYFDWQAKLRSRDIESKLNENLFFTICESLLALLRKRDVLAT